MTHRMVYLIGAGPGDPELLTLKAARALGESDVVLYDSLASTEILRHCRPEAELIFVGKRKGAHCMPQSEINYLLSKFAATYPVVSRLKGGDPFIFGRGGEEADSLRRDGFQVCVVPGVTAACGAAAELGMSLTHRDFSDEVTFITGHKREGESYDRFQNMSLKGRTVIIYMGFSMLTGIAETLSALEENRDIPAAVIANATRAGRRVISGTVSDISRRVRESGLSSPALIILGEVAKFAERSVTPLVSTPVSVPGDREAELC